MGFAGFALASLLLVTSAALSAAMLRLRGFAALLLAAYLLAAAEIVLLTLALSPFHAVTTVGLLAGETLWAIAAVGLWSLNGRPRPRLPALGRAWLRQHPTLLVLACAVAAALLFQLVLQVVAPPNNWDSMTYHLARAAAWNQDHALGYVPNANTERMNIFPPNGEIAILYTLTFLGTDQLAALPQYVAGIALIVGCYAVARQLGFPRSSSAFAALVLASLGQVVLQSTTTQNDLLVASFVLAAAFFVLERDKSGIALAGLAVGLAVGTKTTGVFALPLLGLIALSTLGRRRLIELAASSTLGVLSVGSAGYALNLVHRHSLLGAGKEQNAFRADPSPTGVLSSFARTVGGFVDFPGFLTVSHSLVAALALLAVLVLAPRFLVALDRRRGRGLRPGEAVLCVVLALSPVLVVAVTALERAAGIHKTVNVRSNEDFAFFGPIGAFLVVPVVLITLVSFARGRAGRREAALAAAVPIFVLELAFVYANNDWIGRFMIVPIALVAPLLAAVYPARRLVAGAVVVALVTLFTTIAFNEQKPLGLAGSTPVWSLSRAQVEALNRPRMAFIIDVVDRTVPRRGRLGVVFGPDDWSYPFYGAKLQRRVVYLRPGDALAAASRTGVRDVLFARGRAPHPLPPGWDGRSLGRTGWVLAARR
ncbi:MAG: hypothetical protein QOH73_475 [Gaiellaceae bacterium]|nr:hypothetical protein [Gaiellaceae bacterium]